MQPSEVFNNANRKEAMFDQYIWNIVYQTTVACVLIAFAGMTVSGDQKAISLPSYSTVACIGTGLSGIALGAQLKRWYDFEDVIFFDRHSEPGGTWWIKTYPG